MRVARQMLWLLCLKGVLRSPVLDGTMRDTAGVIWPNYDIITGGKLLHNGKAKYWNGPRMDFRRRR